MDYLQYNYHGYAYAIAGVDCDEFRPQSYLKSCQTSSLQM